MTSIFQVAVEGEQASPRAQANVVSGDGEHVDSNLEMMSFGGGGSGFGWLLKF